MADASDEELDIPDRDTCQKLTEDFAAITRTNEALAQTFLQDHGWDLYKSISAFYDALSEETGKSKETHTRINEQIQARSSKVLEKPDGSQDPYSPDIVQRLFGEGKAVTTEPPPHLKFLSWNLDGLDERELKRRTQAVIETIMNLEPDVVFFQEVVPVTADYFQLKLPEYMCIKGGEENYFTMTMLRVFTIFYDKHYVVDYPETAMGRNLLVTEAHMGKLKLQLLNTHLESSMDASAVRVNQLKTAFGKCSSFSSDYTVIFGGDLNLREREAVVSPGFHDLWEYCGSPKDFRYTWDMTKNTNHGTSHVKARFDRIYVRFGKPERAKPKHFALTGFKKAAKTQLFPSDHWGIVAVFDLDHSV